MPDKSRIIVVSLLILLGGALFTYCVLFYPIEIATPVQGGSATVTGVKAAPKTSTGAVDRNKSRQAGQTRSRPRSGAT